MQNASQLSHDNFHCCKPRVLSLLKSACWVFANMKMQNIGWWVGRNAESPCHETDQQRFLFIYGRPSKRNTLPKRNIRYHRRILLQRITIVYCTMPTSPLIVAKNNRGGIAWFYHHFSLAPTNQLRHEKHFLTLPWWRGFLRRCGGHWFLSSLLRGWWVHCWVSCPPTPVLPSYTYRQHLALDIPVLVLVQLI